MNTGISKQLVMKPKFLSTNLKNLSNGKYRPYTALNFEEIDKKAQKFTDIIESRFDELSEILLRYESYEVVRDEVNRTLDLLRNLKENKKYFKLRIGAIAAFLPRNQPLYAFTCFVIVPSLMASEVHFRIPHSMKNFFHDMLALLDISELFPNVIVSTKQRIDFLIERSAMLMNPDTKESRPLTDVVIFTGTTIHANQLRSVFDKRTLFIANGSGHNPIVISKDADILKAVEAVLTLQFYNQGQDCASPNSILVHDDIFLEFLSLLRQSVATVKVGHYADTTSRIGPISDPKDLIRIQNFLVEHQEWIDPLTVGIIRTKEVIVEPTIICKPLLCGGNFNEIFAPIIVVQKYLKDSDLKLYFEDQRYVLNAMYVTLYGTSTYVKNLVGRPIRGKVLHQQSSLIQNTHLHALGVERGTKPYGGYGYGASSTSINGKITPMPTLPQRDIYERLAKPILLGKKTMKNNGLELQNFTKIYKKDVHKLLRLPFNNKTEQEDKHFLKGITYVDTNLIRKDNLRYVTINESTTYRLLESPNKNFITSLSPEDSKLIRALNKLLQSKSDMSPNVFSTLLYEVSKKSQGTKEDKKRRQAHFFELVYQLLFGINFGPKLTEFLYEVDGEKLHKLLGV
ncbi:MAG: hypothetical protein COX06_00265 [Candidatus Zambryskibacteria bacterium CG22_combo_CG10-13_8_21_14_all_42_17]|uniref:Aldehyde dehydrogenase domain-containing protein n=1 Tax=Candidatus Zambryskibacteria bacterium CG22_combo_CG10-13_8_21_14_all_42_17 TaxID=1975118 RepID=A0A2H0BEA2_9BACT|nr:MAG: hypothetical protein COX06_00265 [Candidatus Zambryskibacteria bacterium CG22_combo_CG10-13_8_21_14_all_42_17]